MGPTSDHFPDGLYRVSCIMTLYLADTELTKTQTFTAIYWPQQKALHLFTDEFRLERRLQGLGPGSWITQQFVLWARGLPPATLVLPIEISRVDEENEENKIRRDRLWHAMGFRFPAGKPAQCRCGQTNCSCHGAGAQRSGGAPVSAVRRLEDCYRGLQEKSCSSKAKTVAKQLITSLKNRPFYHLLHRKEGQLPDEKCDALPLRAEKLSLPQSGIQTGGGATGNRGHPAGYPVCSVAEKNPGAGKGACLAK